MSNIVIHLVGAITLSCGNPTVALPDPCTVTPRRIEMLIPDGRFNSKQCKTGNRNDPTIAPHEAFIRIRGARAQSSPAWPGAIECDDGPKPCVLYPIVKRGLSIDGISSGGGAKFTNLADFDDDISWKKLFAAVSLPLPKLGNGNQLGRMEIRNGEITFDEVNGLHGAVGATITAPKPSGPIIIKASSNSNQIELTVPDNATIEILNLPRATALKFANGATHDDCDHFFLHYALADNAPNSNCPAPNDGQCPIQHGHPGAGNTLACSNSNYP